MVKDSTIEELLAENATEITLKQTTIDGIKSGIREAQQEHAMIQDAAARFGLFLKKNSITPYSDATLDHVDHQIKQEYDKVAVANVSRERLNGLIQRSRGTNPVNQKSIASGNDDEAMDENDVERLVQELYSLKHWGKNCKRSNKMQQKPKKQHTASDPMLLRGGRRIRCSPQSRW